MTALNNLGPVAKKRKNHERSRDYFQQAVSLAREIGAQDMVALCLLNTAAIDIALGNLSARMGLREGLVLALRLGALPWVVQAVTQFAELAHCAGYFIPPQVLWNWRCDFRQAINLFDPLGCL
jgi:hypothetical protein